MNMTRSVAKKSQTMREISLLLGLPEISPTKGSSVPSVFFNSVAGEMGIPVVNGMPRMARKIIEAAHLPWRDNFSSEIAPSGGGGTVTALGLMQVKNAVLVWQGKAPEPLPEELVFEDWHPDLRWEEIRADLPREYREFIERPGARDFRNLVLNEYDSKCVVSGTTALETIDVAHIVPYYGEQSDEIQNAIPLRADLHRLFDRGLLRIIYEPSIRDFIVQIHENVSKDYSGYHGTKLFIPVDALSAPSKFALAEQHKIFSDLWTVI